MGFSSLFDLRASCWTWLPWNTHQGTKVRQQQIGFLFLFSDSKELWSLPEVLPHLCCGGCSRALRRKVNLLCLVLDCGAEVGAPVAVPLCLLPLTAYYTVLGIAESFIIWCLMVLVAARELAWFASSKGKLSSVVRWERNSLSRQIYGQLTYVSEGS